MTVSVPPLEVVAGLKGSEILASSNLNQLATGTLVRIDGKSAPPEAAGVGKRGEGSPR